MPEYDVMVQNVEENEENVSVTGTVNGRSVAAVVRSQKVPSSGNGRVKALDEALVDAYLAMPPPGPNVVAHRVKR